MAVVKNRTYSQLCPQRMWGVLSQDTSFWHFSGYSSYGSSVPFWRAAIKSNENATSDRSVDVTSDLKQTPLKLSCKSSEDGSITWAGEYTFLPASLAVEHPDLAKAERAAQAAIFDKMRQGVQMIPILREAKKTMNMLSSPFKSFRKAVSNYSSRDHQLRARNRPQFNATPGENQKRAAMAKREYVKAASDSWLEFNFGVTPLLLDIKAAAVELAQVLNGPSRITFSEGFTVRNEVPWQFYSYISRINRENMMHERKASRSVIVRYRGAFTPKLTGPACLGGARIGSTLPDFLPSIWEAMPYSWLIDYFVNVGDVLNGYAAAHMTELDWMCKSVVSEYKLESRILNDPGTDNPYWFSTGFSPMYNSIVSKNIVRLSDPGLLFPNLEFRTKLGPVHLTNIAALVTSREADKSFARALSKI